jgi:hypothetical protein
MVDCTGKESVEKARVFPVIDIPRNLNSPMRKVSYLIEGGAPAGIIMIPDDWGCRTNSTSINIMTMHGNSRTMPRGIEIEELPFIRMRRRKKFNRGDSLSARRVRSSRPGMLAEEGILLTRF